MCCLTAVPADWNPSCFGKEGELNFFQLDKEGLWVDVLQVEMQIFQGTFSILGKR